MARLSPVIVAAIIATLSSANAQSTAGQWGQCGGITGTTASCPSGWSCVVVNPYYYQCLQSSTTAGATTSTSVSAITSSSAVVSTKTTTSSTSTTGGGGGVITPIPTRLPDWLWIRAVTPPNFHKYMQSYNSYAPGTTILGDASKAAQFQVNSGQLVHYLDGSSQLYANVEPRADSSVTKLKVTFATTPDTLGTFAWSGDALTWTTPGISRGNAAAWLACTEAEGQVLYINLGAYGYMTPSGCSDHTIHYYNANQPDV
ncbi:hypothetical protein FRC03_003836 [Tulasnella sp. 419]|nr:hypothetical protein FRC02_003552 [Tulasnella sp. 418]KAG8962741.1 hypothetical protein FRC03_003836 [Tulasnella sp. 419]